ncbi:peroxiredoxin-like family protein [Gilvimarinus sp. 1_MG-2023]|uniref:peroxiredoxin-like family protein n=1 Tax=Gilvimarinus sp. 1_MG-2023 TaxID=3062638 RepID=UPI0026E26A9C|nr:peroxiredoxin-like family protein [Gilvimarinus sp. 1_MG-2023]MDO6746592.1 peroxiredoxin-like family protein [Gilvimarinus sp. 1_MG-2023]
MSDRKISSAAVFPDISVKSADNTDVLLGQRQSESSWKMVVVYRGKHCPICTKYLNELENYKQRLADMDVELVAVSADSSEQLNEHKEQLEVSFALYHSLSIEQMQTLGVYISQPRSAKETDHPFAEPALFIINGDGRIQIVDIANAPFSRPDPEILVSGLEFIRDPENDYPIRGTYS